MADLTTDEQTFLDGLGRSVRSARAVRGMSRRSLAQASGLSERYIAQLEGGQGNVSILLLRRIAGAIGTRLDDLIATEVQGPDWAVLRELIAEATPDRIAEAKAVLSGESSERRSAERIALIGLRGAGKSTLGRMAAEQLGWRFVELNREIERENGLTVAEIFALYGQDGYRRLEQTQLRRLIAQPGPLILATGGGIVADPLTLDLVLSSFFTIWLRASPEEHMQRVRDQGDLRPMGDDRSAMQELRAILVSREPLYARADATVDTAGRAAIDAAAALVDRIREARGG